MWGIASFAAESLSHVRLDRVEQLAPSAGGNYALDGLAMAWGEHLKMRAVAALVRAGRNRLITRGFLGDLLHRRGDV